MPLIIVLIPKDQLNGEEFASNAIKVIPVGKIIGDLNSAYPDASPILNFLKDPKHAASLQGLANDFFCFEVTDKKLGEILESNEPYLKDPKKHFIGKINHDSSAISLIDSVSSEDKRAVAFAKFVQSYGVHIFEKHSSSKKTSGYSSATSLIPPPVTPADLAFKIVLVGDTGAGKTCLFKFFTENKFDEETSPTIALDFASKTLPYQHNDESKTIRLQIWDVGGKGLFYSPTCFQHYCKNTHVTILAVVGQEGLEIQVQAIKKQFEAFIKDTVLKDTPIILAITQCDDDTLGFPIDQLKEALKKESIQFADIVITSAKNNKNVTALFTAATKAALAVTLKTAPAELSQTVDAHPSKGKPKRIAFFPAWNWKRSSMLLLLTLIFASVGLPLLFTGTSVFVASLLLPAAIAALASLIALKGPKNPFNKMAMLIGIHIGTFAGAATGFILGLYFTLYFPIIGPIFGLLMGAIVGAIVGPLLSIPIAHLIDWLRWADPQGIKIAGYATPAGLIIGLGIGIALSFAMPFGILIPALTGAAVGAAIAAIIGGIVGYYSNDVDLDSNKTLNLLGKAINKQSLIKPLENNSPTDTNYSSFFDLPASDRFLNSTRETDTIINAWLPHNEETIRLDLGFK